MATSSHSRADLSRQRGRLDLSIVYHVILYYTLYYIAIHIYIYIHIIIYIYIYTILYTILIIYLGSSSPGSQSRPLRLRVEPARPASGGGLHGALVGYTLYHIPSTTLSLSMYIYIYTYIYIYIYIYTHTVYYVIQYAIFCITLIILIVRTTIYTIDAYTNAIYTRGTGGAQPRQRPRPRPRPRTRARAVIAQGTVVVFVLYRSPIVWS